MKMVCYPVNWFIERPYLAILPVLIFGFCYLGLRSGSAKIARRTALTAAILWLLYAIYEWRMFLWSRTVSAPIRVDLLLIAPVLYLTTVAGVVASIVGFRRTFSTRLV
jgi:hypothetical protein